MKTRYRQTVAKINLNNIYQNYIDVQKRVGNKTIIPVVKANAYGHGALEVVQYLYEQGIDYFAVSLLEEALEIREKFPNVGLLCMGVIENDGLLIASENNITVAMSNFAQLLYVRNLSKTLTIHLKVDTGMNRLGFKSDQEIEDAFSMLTKNPNIFVEGLFTHFSTADENKDYYDFQFNRFQEIQKLLNYDFPMIHISNSSSQIKYEQLYDFTTHTRLGISLYGLTTDISTTFLHPTIQLVSKISQVKYLASGDKVGYGASYTATGDEIIGIVPIGYADGFIRKNTGGDVEINGKRYPIIGRICMDQCFVRIDDTITTEDDVILFGGLITVDEVAKRLDTINYEIICNITSRVPREYIK